MKFFIGRLAISEAGSGACHLDQALFVAKDEAQAKDLNESRAMMWGGDDGQVIVGGAWRFHDEKTGTFTVHPNGVLEISATAFDDLKDWLPVFGDSKTADIESQEPAEAVKTLARRIGDQLVKHDAKVSHSKLLHALAASLGHTDWQVLSKATSAALAPAAAQLPLTVRVESKSLGEDGRFQVDGYVNNVRIIEIDNRLDASKWYLGQSRTLPWAHSEALDGLACFNAVFAEVERLSKAPYAAPTDSAGAESKSWFPGGNWPTTKLEDIRTFDFVARVNAIWLAQGDVRLAAKLLHVDPDALMNSFVDPMEADTAFCGRPVGWSPTNSLAPNLSMFTMKNRSNGYLTERELSSNYKGVLRVGYVSETEMFRFSDIRMRGTPICTWGTAELPTKLHDVSMLAECLNETLRMVYEDLRTDRTPPKH